jgi:hypothetical protein
MKRKTKPVGRTAVFEDLMLPAFQKAFAKQLALLDSAVGRLSR